MEGYESIFAAPQHTVVERRQEGLEVITTVIIEGKVQEFVSPMQRLFAYGESNE